MKRTGCLAVCKQCRSRPRRCCWHPDSYWPECCAAGWLSDSSGRIGTSGPEVQKCRGFQVGTLPLHGEMQVRAGGASARSTLCDALTPLYGRALFHQKLREVHIQSEDGFSVIDYDQTAFEVHVANNDGAPGVGGFDPGAHRGGIVETVVSTLRAAVVDAAHTERRSITGIRRGGEGTLPKTLGRR